MSAKMDPAEKETETEDRSKAPKQKSPMAPGNRRSKRLKALDPQELSASKMMRASISTPDFRILQQRLTKQEVILHGPASPRLKRRITQDEIISRRYYLLATAKSMTSSVKDFIKADIPLTSNDFPLCPHKHHCLQNAFFKGFFRTFAAGYTFKTTVAVFSKAFVGKIFNKYWRENLSKIYFDEDTMKFSLFFALMSFTFKAILCLLRRTLKRDPVYHKTIAGFIAASFCLIDNADRRKTLALYCIVRSLSDALLLCVHKKLIPEFKQASGVSFTASQLLIMFGALHAKKTVDPRYYKWIVGMSGVTDDVITKTFRSTISDAMYRLPGEPFPACANVFHDTSSCLLGNMIDFYRCMGRAGRMYFPVHFLPALLFTPKKVFSHPLTYLWRKTLGTLRSSTFLSMYVFNMRMTVCWFRHFLKDDPGWVAVLGGLAAGLPIWIEPPKRRIELALYVIPRALEILMRLIPKSKFPNFHAFLRWKYLPVISIQVSIAMWVTVIASQGGKDVSNGLNMTVLRVILGSRH